MTNPVRTGAGAFKVTSNSTVGAAGDGSPGPTLGTTTADGTVTATGYAEGTVAGTVYLCLRYVVGGTTSNACGPATSVTSTAFSQVTASVTVPANATAVYVVLGRLTAANYAVTWDDVTVSDPSANTAAPSTTPASSAPAASAPAASTPAPSASQASTSAAAAPSGTSTVYVTGGTVSMDATQYGQLLFLLFGFCSLALLLLAVVAGKAML